MKLDENTTVTINYSLSEEAYRARVVAGDLGTQDKSFDCPVVALSPAARLALLDYQGGFKFEWAVPVAALPTLEEVSDHIIIKLYEEVAELEKIAAWCRSHLAELVEHWGGLGLSGGDIYKSLVEVWHRDFPVDYRIDNQWVPDDVKKAVKIGCENRRAAVFALELEARRIRQEAVLVRLEKDPTLGLKWDNDWNNDQVSGSDLHGDGHNAVDGAVRDRMLAVRARGLVIAATRASDKERQEVLWREERSIWLSEHGTENMKSRLLENLLPEEEFADAIRNWAFAPLDGFVRYQRLRESDVPHSEACDGYDCHPYFDVDGAGGLTAEEYANLCAIRTAAGGGPIPVAVAPRTHSGTSGCETEETEGKVFRRSALCTTSFAGLKLSREYGI